MGLQVSFAFLIYLILNLSIIISAAPFAQRKDGTNKGGCQIDLLIHTDLDVFFLCELKCRKVLDKTIIKRLRN